MGMESGHYYLRDGSPCYEQPTKAGGMRGINLRWDRHLGLVPSVTTVLQVLAKPQLEMWKVRQGILAALTLARNDGECDDDYLARVMADSKEQAKAAAEEGTRIHDAIEQSFIGGKVQAQYERHVNATRTLIRELFPDVYDWTAEASFAHPSGYGGKVDLHSPSTGIVIDYKGKDGDFSDKKKLAYDQHYQLAAYQYGLQLPTNVCANIFVSRTHPGCVAHHLWTADELADGLGIFTDSLTLWKRLKHYDSSFINQQKAA
jgi:hypothetical protein